MNEQSSSRFKSCSCSDNHCIGLTHDGRAFTWALTSQGNRFGQLCLSLPTSLHPANINDQREVSIGQRIIAVGAGGDKEAGHTALVGEDGSLFMCGCDRWQQLGLSTQKADIGGNAAGYTWEGGKIWQNLPQRVAALSNVKIIKVGCSRLIWLVCDKIQQVALGKDHTLALDADERTVYAWGKSSDGQLGTAGKAFMRPPSVSQYLSAPATGAAIVQGLHALGDCSAAAHSSRTSSKPTVVSVGKNCTALEKAFRDAFAVAMLQ
jgi:alpha-tubulin suppressor-like RCC1 family protein